MDLRAMAHAFVRREGGFCDGGPLSIAADHTVYCDRVVTLLAQVREAALVEAEKVARETADGIDENPRYGGACDVADAIARLRKGAL